MNGVGPSMLPAPGRRSGCGSGPVLERWANERSPESGCGAETESRDALLEPTRVDEERASLGAFGRHELCLHRGLAGGEFQRESNA